MSDLTSLDDPQLFKDYIQDAELLANWKDIEFCINNPWQYNPSIIHKTLATRIPLKYSNSFWFDKAIPDKQQVMDYVKQGHTLVLENFSVHSIATHAVCKKIEDIMNVTADMHLHCSLGKSNSHPIHCVTEDNFILQVSGETAWKVYDKLGPTGSAVIDTILRPGDLLFIPSNTYQAADPFEKRISISIPCSKLSNPIDRRNLKLL